MRTSEERVRELHRRMDGMRRSRHQLYLLTCTAAGAAGLAASILLALMLSQLQVHSPGVMTAGASASIIVDHAVLGYTLIAVVAFSLGVLLTVFCSRLRREMGEEEKNDDRKL